MTTPATVIDVTTTMTSNMTSSEEDEEGPTRGQKSPSSALCRFSVCLGLSATAWFSMSFSSKGNKVTSTIFILALAWADIFTCSIIIPLTIAFTATDGDMGYDLLCKLYHFLITFNVPLAAFIMVAIAVDRYFSICHPFLYAVTPRRARVTVFFLCMFAFLLGTITALAYGYVDLASMSNIHNNGSSLQLENATVYATTSLPVGGGGGNVTTFPVLTTSGNLSIWDEVDYVPMYRCFRTEKILSHQFLEYYQKFYASFYLLSLLAVLIIYAFIYRSVVRRREWRRRQRSSRPIIKSPETIATDVEEFELRTKNGMEALNDDNGNNNGDGTDTGTGNDTGNQLQQGNGNPNNTGSGKRKKRKSRSENSSISGETRCLNNTASQKKASKERRDFNFLANIRTAGMLFVVSIVFIISFLPAWLMAVRVIAFHIVVFYLYFVYNVANPVIYAFMNHAFRKELKRMVQRGLNYCRD